MSQTNEAEWAEKERKGRERFLYPTYTIKDRFRQPGTPFLVAAFYISASGKPAIKPENEGPLDTE